MSLRVLMFSNEILYHGLKLRVLDRGAKHSLDDLVGKTWKKNMTSRSIFKFLNVGLNPDLGRSIPRIKREVFVRIIRRRCLITVVSDSYCSAKRVGVISFACSNLQKNTRHPVAHRKAVGLWARDTIRSETASSSAAKLLKQSSNQQTT